MIQKIAWMRCLNPLARRVFRTFMMRFTLRMKEMFSAQNNTLHRKNILLTAVLNKII